MGNKIFKKWQKSREKLEKSKVIEINLRKKLGNATIQGEETKITLLEGDFKVVITKKTGYSTPSTSINRLKKKLGDEKFTELFNANYSIREGVYKKLSVKQKKIVDSLVRVYEAPYQVTVTER
jgi:hypothetical protein